MKKAAIGMCIVGFLFLAGTAFGPQSIKIISAASQSVSKMFTGQTNNPATTLMIRVNVRGSN